jgi:hypothetical protein
MGFYVGNNANANVNATSNGFNVATFTTATRPSSPVQGQVIYNSTTQTMQVYANGAWNNVGVFPGTAGYLYRQVITKSFVCGGYQNSSPWRNVNRMTHATDVCTNLGDLLAQAGAYVSGVNNTTRGFIWSCDGMGAGTTTCAINMNTETTAGTNSAWNIRISRDDSATGFKETEFAFIMGGNSATMDIFNLTTESMYIGVPWQQPFNTSLSYNAQGSADSGSVSDENACYFWSTSQGSTKLTFNTHTFTNNGIDRPAYEIRGTPIGGAHGQQKGINSKLGRGYAGANGSYNGGYIMYRMVFSTETATTINKPIGNSGEENLDMGQSHQYMMGMYDGAQNNRGWKFTYGTDTGIELGSGSVRTGVPGGSSGHCVWSA